MGSIVRRWGVVCLAVTSLALAGCDDDDSSGGGGADMGAPGMGGDPGAGGAPGMGGEPGMGGNPIEPPPPVEGAIAAARIGMASIAGGADNRCQDLSGDGRPNNAFAGIGGLANGELQTALDEGQLNLMPVSIGLAAPGANGRFDLAVLTGDEDGAGGFVVDPDSLDAQGQPLILFRGATAANGTLQAGPGDFALQLPVQGQELNLQLTSTAITGTISVTPDGLRITGGIISGQISQADLDAALVVVPPDLVGLVPIFLQPDIDSDGVGGNDSYSLCLTFEADPAPLAGFPVE
ncbi:MAG: hypothetical protein H6704_10805 [Myxococcales bacterium]|nr:hypothetical protein [Myxococcales bacterium]